MDRLPCGGVGSGERHANETRPMAVHPFRAPAVTNAHAPVAHRGFSLPARSRRPYFRWRRRWIGASSRSRPRSTASASDWGGYLEAVGMADSRVALRADDHHRAGVPDIGGEFRDVEVVRDAARAVTRPGRASPVCVLAQRENAERRIPTHVGDLSLGRPQSKPAAHVVDRPHRPVDTATLLEALAAPIGGRRENRVEAPRPTPVGLEEQPGFVGVHPGADLAPIPERRRQQHDPLARAARAPVQEGEGRLHDEAAARIAEQLSLVEDEQVVGRSTSSGSVRSRRRSRSGVTTSTSGSGTSPRSRSRNELKARSGSSRASSLRMSRSRAARARRTSRPRLRVGTT
jgi:hypothetical protein